MSVLWTGDPFRILNGIFEMDLIVQFQINRKRVLDLKLNNELPHSLGHALHTSTRKYRRSKCYGIFKQPQRYSTFVILFARLVFLCYCISAHRQTYCLPTLCLRGSLFKMNSLASEGTARPATADVRRNVHF